MGRKRRESIDKGEGRAPSDGEGPTDDLFEQIRRLEEEKKRVEDEKRRLEEEKERLEEEIRRIERENEIFRKILDTRLLFRTGIQPYHIWCILRISTCSPPGMQASRGWS